ncbi:MAG TPA: hypothetical protein VFQ53_07890 [Kofleriaceae bacterium]|nr:hypothetical protein [Kofleriaceae bacterium]
MRTAVTCALVAAWGTCVVACSPFSGGGAFTCTDSTQCSSAGVMGTCEPNGFCSFLDPNCPSGSRYGSSSGPNSDRCVGEEVPIDAREADATVIDMPLAIDAACDIGGLDLCARQPLGPLNVAVSETLNTNDDPRCQDLSQGTGPTACLVYVSSVSVGAGATLQAIGDRPLVIASVGSIAVFGTIDASSYRNGPTGAGANFSTCAPKTLAADDPGGGGGAAGGSFRGQGGDGGTGDSDDSLPPNQGTGTPGTAADPIGPPEFARGGCPGARGGNEGTAGGDGRGGSGGSGGGALWLFANDVISVNGIVRATGAGGNGGQKQAGGGGGGSGGYIKLVASSINVGGVISANGGGGGEGGCTCNSLPLTGDFGGNGNASNVQADGGSSFAMPGGDGGRASANTLLDGSNGQSSAVGGGGGGGGAGFVVLVGNTTITGIVTPVP